jgi:hypothetical protein
MRVAGAVAGVLIVISVWLSVVVTLIIPRGRVGYFKFIDQPLDHVYTIGLGADRSWDGRGTSRSGQPIVTLGLLLVTWLDGFVLAFALLLWPSERSFPSAIRESGSSLFTLGFASTDRTGPSTVDFVTAASGLVVALQIAYLPTLYVSYNRRETDITLLSRMQIADGGGQLTTIYQTWERWSADVAESHASYSSLTRSDHLSRRAPGSSRNSPSWIQRRSTSLLAPRARPTRRGCVSRWASTAFASLP